MIPGRDKELLFELDNLCVYACIDENGPQILLCDDLDNPNFVVDIREKELAVLNAIVACLFNRHIEKAARKYGATGLDVDKFLERVIKEGKTK